MTENEKTDMDDIAKTIKEQVMKMTTEKEKADLDDLVRTIRKRLNISDITSDSEILNDVVDGWITDEVWDYLVKHRGLTLDSPDAIKTFGEAYEYVRDRVPLVLELLAPKTDPKTCAHPRRVRRGAGIDGWETRCADCNELLGED